MGFTPQAFGKYYLVDKIATGGMAEIFKAKTYSHGGFENLLVIKRILPHIGENEDFIEMFIDEAKVSVALQHANIVRVYDFGKILDNYFIAMECVDGKDVRNLLRKLARKRTYLPPQFAAYVAHEVCKGLHYAHTKADLQGNTYGIVHRDISPSNVIIAYEGDVKVADFGIAKAESNAYQTRDGVLKGKYEYMSPEQATGKEIDHRSDLFSVGIILYETLTGRRLFKADSEIATLEKIRNCDFRAPTELNPAIPQELEAICLRALARFPEDRYQTAQAMADDLRRFLHPVAPDELREEMRSFMAELFADEIDEERARLEQHSLVARQLRDSAGAEAWDGHESTMGSMPRPPANRMLPIVLGVMVVLFGMVAVASAAVAWVVTTQPARTVEQPVARTGTIDVLVLPAAEIFLDGDSQGRADTLTLRDLEPGAHTLRLEAEGHVPVEETVRVEAGDALRFSRTLERVPAPEPEPAPEQVEEPPEEPEASQPVARDPAVRFTSRPSGATVRVDGTVIGTTPMTWRGGRAGGGYSVVLELDGHQPVTARVSGLEPGRTVTVDRTLPEVASPGNLTVTLVGGGWANVYVDGTKLNKTAPLKDWPLDAGTHEVRVENAALGIDHTETVKVGSGEAVTVRAMPR